MNTIITNAAQALTICIAVTVGLSAADVSAGNLSTDRSGAPTYVVRFADLDLSRIDGVTKLYGRLGHAGRAVCDALVTTQWFTQEYRACVDKAIADAVAIVNRPLLTQYHQLRTKGDKAGIVQLAKAQ